MIYQDKFTKDEYRCLEYMQKYLGWSDYTFDLLIACIGFITEFKDPSNFIVSYETNYYMGLLGFNVTRMRVSKEQFSKARIGSKMAHIARRLKLIFHKEPKNLTELVYGILEVHSPISDSCNVFPNTIMQYIHRDKYKLYRGIIPLSQVVDDIYTIYTKGKENDTTE